MNQQMTNSRLMVLMFTDLVDSSALKVKLGDGDYVQSIARPHNAAFRRVLAQFPDAQENNFTGDGFLATFERVSDAVNAALLFHHALRSAEWQHDRPQTRIGIHLGESVLYEGTDTEQQLLASHAADMCARVMGLGAGEQTLLTRAAFDSARQYIRSHPPVDGQGEPPPLEWLAHGRYLFKGGDDPMEVFEVGATGWAPLSAPQGSEKARRSLSVEEEQTLGWRPAAGREIPGRAGWVIENKIGEGGFGEVWLARNARTKETRVFKFCFDVDRLRSFKRELTLFRLIREALGKRDDIAELREVRLDKPPFYLESDFVEQGNLSDWAELQGGIREVPLDTRLDLLARVARAAAAAHSLGIIHKDIKPSNIFVRENDNGEPRPVLADFGIGAIADRVLLEKHGVTAAGFTETVLGNQSSRTGTRMYSPPESQAGQPATTAGDIYALGVLLYQMAVADFSKPLATGWEQHIEDELLASDIRACVEGDPSQRMGNAVELAERLETLDERHAALAAERRVEAELLETAQHAVDTARRMRRLKIGLAIASVFLAVTVTLGVVSFMQWKRANKSFQHAQANEKMAIAETRIKEAALEQAKKRRIETENALALVELQRLEADGARIEAQQQRDLARKRLYLVKIASAHHAIQNNDFAIANKLLSGSDHDLRGWEYRYLRRIVRRRMTTFKGHTGWVNSVAFSPDGRRIVSGSQDKTLRVWDAATGKKTLTLKGHAKDVYSVAFSPDGQRIVSGSLDKTLKVWDAKTGEETLTLKGHMDLVLSVVFSPDGQQIVSGSNDKTLKLWDAKTGEETLTLKGHTEEVISVAFSPDGRWIVSGSNDETLRVWDANTGAETLVLKGHTHSIRSVAFSADGQWIVSGSYDETLKVWDAKTGEETLTLKGHLFGVESVAFSPDNRQIVSGDEDATMKMWDAKTGEEILSLKGHFGGVSSVAFSPDGKQFVSGSLDKTLKVWDAKRREESPTLRGHKFGVLSAVFSPDGRRIISGGRAGKLKMWDANTHEETVTLKRPLYWPWISSVAFSPDGQRIVSSGGDETVRVWDSTTGNYTLALKGHTSNVPSVVFSPNGRRIVSGSHDETLKMWDSKTGVEIFTLKGHTDDVNSVAFSPDGRRIVSGSDDHTLKVWDATTGVEIFTLKGHTDSINSVAFSPDGQRIVSGSLDKTLKVWDAKTGEETLTLKGHTENVISVAFSPDGWRIVSGSWDRTLKIWDAKTGDETLTLKGHARMINSVAFSPDGRRIVSGSDGGTLILWDASTDGNEGRLNP